MKVFTVDLKEEYPFLKDMGKAAILTCYLPHNSAEIDINRKHPPVLITPGGAYHWCSEREAEPSALPFLAKGFSAFVLTYDCYPAHYPVALTEAAAAIHYIRTHAEELFIIPDKLTVQGGSAGGHLAASMSTLWKEPFLAERFRCDSRFLRPDAQILSYPVITFMPHDLCHIDSLIALTGNSTPTEEQREFFSLENHVDADTPTAFIWHTSADACVPVESSMRYGSALAKAGVPFEMHVYPYGGHGLSVSNYTVAPNMNPDFIMPRPAKWVDEALSWLAMIYDLKY